MTCKHQRIITFVTEDGEPVGLWGCADCNVRFAPIADQIKAEQQRDELLNKAEALMEFVVGHLPSLGYVRDSSDSRVAISELRAAIANVKDKP